jgi:hypothetical protein
MARGGKRPGAGRPQGALNRATESQRATLSELARDHTEEAVAALVDVMRNGASESARIAAANAVLDRVSIPAQNWSVSRRDIGRFRGALSRVPPM